MAQTLGAGQFINLKYKGLTQEQSTLWLC